MTPNFAVDPIFIPYPGKETKAYPIIIPLKGIKPHPTEYGAVISVGWTYPTKPKERIIHDSKDEEDEDCDDSYPDFCILPPPPNLNCDDISEVHFTVKGSDPHGFDGDNDGSGCDG